MDPKEATRFVKEIKPKLAIPIHYDNPNLPFTDPEDFEKEMEGSGINVKILNFGESIEI